jgi:hypothetical protein
MRGSGTAFVERAIAGVFFPDFAAFVGLWAARAGIAVAASVVSTTSETRKKSCLLLSTDHPPGQT